MTGLFTLLLILLCSIIIKPSEQPKENNETYKNFYSQEDYHIEMYDNIDCEEKSEEEPVISSGGFDETNSISSYNSNSYDNSTEYDDFDSYMDESDDFMEDYNAWANDDFDYGDCWEDW